MEGVVLGRTGLRVHPAGLGCGGHSRLGQGRGASVDDSIAVVRRALELGVNFIDTARVYGTEEIVGKALAGRRDAAVLSTKALAAAVRKRIGILAMFAVRRALARPRQLAKLMRSLRREGQIPDDVFDRRDPLGFLVREGGAASVIEAAYRFCRHEPGVHVVLTGTGDLAHLEQNVASIERGPLRTADLRRLEEIFGAVDSVSGN